MKIFRATPVLFADRVEPARDFFKRAGFQVNAEVPAGDAVGFAKVLLERHTTFYNSDELTYEEPGGGNLVTFAKFA